MTASERRTPHGTPAPNSVIRVALALAIVASVLAVPTAAAEATAPFAETAVTRYDGADRYATSLQVAEAVAADVGGRLEWAVMVSGRSWTDAVVAAPLAGMLKAPVLTTPPDTLRPNAASFLGRTGVSKVLIVGADSDTEGVSEAVAIKLRAQGISVERITRPDQYATAVAAARRLGTPGDMKGLGRTAVVASGEVFVDSLVAGAFAARGPHPILLTRPHNLRLDVADYLIDTSIEHVVLMGGTAALHEAVEDSIAALGIEVTRLAGATRYDTAIAAAELVERRYGLNCFGRTQAGLARADVPFDAFSAAPLLARLCAPLLLSDRITVPIPTRVFLDEARSQAFSDLLSTFKAHVLGGNAAISKAAVDAYVVGTPSDRATCEIDFKFTPTVLINGVDWVRPAWSPDCTRIAYVKNGTVWTAKIDGSDQKMLAVGSFPSWSPDGKRLAFARFTDRVALGEHVAHLHVINADGTGETQVTDGLSQDVSPKWSPDGRQLLFRRHKLRSSSATTGLSRNRVLVISDADGASQSEIDDGGYYDDAHVWMHDGKRIGVRDTSLATRAIDDSEDWKPVWPVELSDIRFSDHAWSPDRSRIALAVSEHLDSGKWRTSIKVIHLDDSSLVDVVIYTRSPGQPIHIHSPSWLPDGSGIAYIVEEFGAAARHRIETARVRTP